MPLEEDLVRLLASIDPELQPGTFVFCALGPEEPPTGLAVQMLFRELEGTTVVVSLGDSESRALRGEFPCQWIILGVRSDLAAVGFLAAVTARLAVAGISANVVSAAHHDHVFVPVGRGDDAMRVLRELQGRHQDGR